MLEKALIDYAAPTLAGIKPASLYSYHGTHADEEIAELNRSLTKRGVRLITLGRCRANTDKPLLYAYRPALLEKILSRPDVRSFLLTMGYRPDWSVEDCLAHLSSRLHPCENFPHEIGVFLGYPLHDVLGFIQHKGQNYCCHGMWKVYAEVEQAQKQFARYSHCTEVYRRCYGQGRTLTQLTVAG